MALSNQIINSRNRSSVKVLQLCVGALKTKCGRVLWTDISPKCEYLWYILHLKEKERAFWNRDLLQRSLVCPSFLQAPLRTTEFPPLSKNMDKVFWAYVHVSSACLPELSSVFWGPALVRIQPRVAAVGGCKRLHSFKVLSCGGEL